jgi:hypothetical protein
MPIRPMGDHSHTLAVHRFLLRASLSIGMVFAWVLIFHALYVSGETASGALLLTASTYALLQVWIFFMTPLAARNVRNGTVRSMILSSLAQASAFLWLAAAAAGVFGNGSLNLWWGIFGFVFLAAVYRAFYWVPYSAVGISAKGHWTHQTRSLLEIFLALIPVAAALVIVNTDNGAWLVLVGAAVFAFLASVTLIGVPDSYERFSWNFSETIYTLFSRENKPLLTSSYLEGMQGAGLLFLWPLTIFFLFSWSYVLLGTLLSLTFIIVILTRRMLQRTFDRVSLRNKHRFLAAASGFAWILRLTVVSPFSIIIADVLQHASVPPRRLGIDPLTLEQSADSSHYIDEYTALKEMGNSVGRITACVILIAALLFADPLVALAVALACVAVASIAHVYVTAPGQSVY